MSELGRRHTLIVITPVTGAPEVASTAAGAAILTGEAAPVGPAPLDGAGSGEATADGDLGGDWIPQLIQAQRVGLASSVLLVAMPEDEPAAIDMVRRLVAIDIPAQVLRTDMPLRAALTYRRKRKVIRSTPTGGAYTVEVEEEVG